MESGTLRRRHITQDTLSPQVAQESPGIQWKPGEIIDLFWPLVAWQFASMMLRAVNVGLEPL